MDNALKIAYTNARRPASWTARHVQAAPISARTAILMARQVVKDGHHVPALSPWYGDEPRVGIAVTSQRWIASAREIGAREVGRSDDLCRLRHSGWYMDDYKEDSCWGFVLQIPGKGKRARYLPAIQVSWDKWFMVDLSAMVEGANGEDSAHDRDLADAARDADRMAQAFAEKAREEARMYDADLDALEAALTGEEDSE